MQSITTLPVYFMFTSPYAAYQATQQTTIGLNDQYILSILNYQNYANFQLLQTQNLIASYLNQHNNEKVENVGNTVNQNSQEIQNKICFTPSIQIIHNCKSFQPQLDPQAKLCIQNLKQVHQTIPKKIKKTADSDYEPENQLQQNYKINKSSQSKNVPKNFSKSIGIFIRKQQNKLKKLVEQEHNWQQFLQQTKNLKDYINSIAQLRSLWLEQQNKFAKIYRIISNLYIKCYSLQHIFNSRIQDYSKHLKYRNKISEVLRNPKEFTRMKDY